jgi:poly(3-hydroxybutyrate) depolymerase
VVTALRPGLRNLSRRRSPRRGLIGLVVVLLPAGLGPARAGGPPAEPGRMVERAFTNEAGTRRYLLYVPTSWAAGRPLMVWLHGCGRPGRMEAGHALTKVAEERADHLVNGALLSEDIGLGLQRQMMEFLLLQRRG